MAKKKNQLGTLEKIYILHGWSYSLDKWTPFVRLLKSSGIQAELLRIPGLTQELKKILELEDYVKWLKDIVDKQSNKIILIGHSNGGRIALAYSAKHPQKVSHLLLIDSAGIYHNELPLKIKRTIFKLVTQIGKKFTSVPTLKKIVYKLARTRDYYEASQNMKQTMVNLISRDLTPILSLISVPTTLIWGENDKITPLSDAKIMKDKIGSSKLHIISNAGHAPQFSKPEEVAKLVSEEVKNGHI